MMNKYNCLITLLICFSLSLSSQENKPSILFHFHSKENKNSNQSKGWFIDSIGEFCAYKSNNLELDTFKILTPKIVELLYNCIDTTYSFTEINKLFEVYALTDSMRCNDLTTPIIKPLIQQVNSYYFLQKDKQITKQILLYRTGNIRQENTDVNLSSIMLWLNNTENDYLIYEHYRKRK